jgi:catechol 1,2-dioxygenase
MSKGRIPHMQWAVSRRTFLHGSAMLGGALVAGRAPAATQGCQPTESDTLGPFYRFGAPFRSRLADASEPGDRLVLTGTVLSSDCRTPVPGAALIEMWQANHAGLYDTGKPGNFTEVTTFHLRGMLYTNEQGQYEIETIMPGRYPVPPNLPGLEKYAGLTRPAHIHFRVMESLHVPVTTQLYFKGDPFIASDPFASHKQSLAIDLKPDGKLRRGVFDIVLARGL